MSKAPLAALVIGVGCMAYGFWGLVAASSTSWAATWLDAAWILGGLAVACAGGYAVGNALRTEPA